MLDNAPGQAACQWFRFGIHVYVCINPCILMPPLYEDGGEVVGPTMHHLRQRV